MNNIDRFYVDDSKEFARNYLDYLCKILNKINLEEIDVFISSLKDARNRGATIFFIGNGGSASTASHFANDLSIGVGLTSKPFRAISLTDNQSIITAIGNDYGFDDIFVRQLKVLGNPGDIVVAISASGNSKNLLETFEYAKLNGIKTIGITAFDGGNLKVIADESIHISTGDKEYGPAEDVHMILDHLVSNYLMRMIKCE